VSFQSEQRKNNNSSIIVVNSRIINVWFSCGKLNYLFPNSPPDKQAMNAEEKLQEEHRVMLNLTLDQYSRIKKMVEQVEKLRDQARKRQMKASGREEKMKTGRPTIPKFQFPPLEVVKATSAPIEV